MSYVGNTATTQSFSSGTDYFNGNSSTTAFTLSRPVASVNDVVAVIENVVQQPSTAYTISGSTITFTSAPPTGTSNIYVRYMTTTTQVVQPAQNSVSYSSLNTDLQNATYGYRNRLINGDMRIDQRYSGAAYAGSGYGVDRWLTGSITGAIASIQQVSDAPAGSGLTYSWKWTTTTASTANDYNYNWQYIEQNNLKDLEWGLSTGQTVTLSFWVKSSLTGQTNGFIRYYGSGTAYYYLPTYNINSQNTWEYKTITITAPPSAAGTLTGTGSTGLLVAPITTLSSGYTPTMAGNTWSTTQTYRATGSVVNPPSTLNATIQFTGVQLEKGTTATAFDFRPYGTELALCQRYFYSMGGTTSYEQFAVGCATAATDGRFMIYLPVPMRTQPSIAQTGVFQLASGAGSVGGTYSGGSSMYFANWTSFSGLQNIGTDFFSGSAGSFSSFSTGAGYIIRANGSTATRVTLSAEL
jgi:hypothetical protein